MKYLSKTFIVIVICILYLSMLSLIPRTHSLSSKVSSVIDDVNDLYITFGGETRLSAIYIGYQDIIYAEVRQTTSSILIFEMTVNSRIPFDPDPDESIGGYCWQLDTDFDTSTGNYGSEYNIGVANDGQGWYGRVDVFVGENPDGGLCPIIIRGNTVSVTVHLSQIGNPPSFRWWPNDAFSIRIWKDSDLALQMNDWTDTQAIWIRS